MCSRWEAALDRATAALATEELDGLGDSVLADRLMALRRRLDALEAEWLRRLEVFDRSGGAAAAGAVSAAGWLRSACRLSPGVARARVELARALPGLPDTAAALASGQISVTHAQQVATALAELADTAGVEVAAEAEPALVDVARMVDPARLRRELVHVRHALAPEAAATAAERAYERRGLSASETLDGMVAVDGILDPEGGALLLAALMPLSAPADPDDRRTPRQRRADALTEMARRHLDRGDQVAAGGERPHLTVLVPLDTLERRIATATAETNAIPDGNAEPGTTEPAGTGPGTIEPAGTTKAGSTNPISTALPGTDCANTNRGTTEPGRTEPGSTDPGGTGPPGMASAVVRRHTTERGAPQPARTEPGTTAATGTNPSSTGSASTGSASTGSASTGSGSPGSASTASATTGSGSTRSGSPGSASTGSASTGSDTTGAGSTGTSTIGSGSSGAGGTGSGSPGSASTGSGERVARTRPPSAAGPRAADTGWAGPVTGEAARRLACDARITRVITDGPSQPLDVGRRTRTIPPALRTALIVRDRGCIFPGCDRPPPWTDAHHLVAWIDGGPTSLDNLALLCRRHHRAVHEGQWTLTRSPDETWCAVPPSGPRQAPSRAA